MHGGIRMFEQMNPVEVTESSTEALEMTTEVLEMDPEILEAASEAVNEGADPLSSGEVSVIAVILGLTPEESEVYSAIGNEIPDVPSEKASGYADVKGDCVSTSCTYTKTYYSCPYTS